MTNDENIIVITTTSNKAEAEMIASALLDLKLCACIQIIPIESMYHWKEKLEHSSEFQLLIKSRKGLYLSIEKKIKELHSYDVPEIIFIDIKGGSKEYIQWINDETVKSL